MKKNGSDYSRRDFFKTAGTAGLGALMTSPMLSEKVYAKDVSNIAQGEQVPKRPFGRSGFNVSMLSMGGMYDIPNNQILLKLALQYGVTYWDTAYVYGGGASEKGIGKFFKRNPTARKDVFLVSKAGARDPDDIQAQLNKSLIRLNTDYIDLYFIHGISSPGEMTDDIRRWAEKAKQAGTIKLIGFSTHKNMQDCLLGGAKLGWIDGIMMSYNFRLMHQTDMQDAVAACHAAGIGLTAMKTMGGGSVHSQSEKDLQMGGKFLKQGFTNEQAKLKAVWEDSRIAGICSQMPNSAFFRENIAAALNKTKLTKNDMDDFKQLAAETASDYCAGCGWICESAVAGKVPICDIMRYLMYSRSYGDLANAREQFRALEPAVRERLNHIDYAQAEKRCPQNMAIGRLIKEAAEELA